MEKDVVVCGALTGGDIAKIVSDKLALIGYTVSRHDTPDTLDVIAMVYVVTESSILAEMVKIQENGVASVPVWPNSCPPIHISGVGGISTLEILGTNFELSLDKACERFPESIRKKNDFIRRSIRDGFGVEVLCECSELSSIYKWDEIDDWPGLLKVQPHVADKCEWGQTATRWTNMILVNAFS